MFRFTVKKCLEVNCVINVLLKVHTWSSCIFVSICFSWSRSNRLPFTMNISVLKWRPLHNGKLPMAQKTVFYDFFTFVCKLLCEPLFCVRIAATGWKKMQQRIFKARKTSWKLVSGKGILTL